MRAPDRLDAGLGHAEVLHLALLNQVLDRARHVFDRHGRIDAMLIVEIHDVGLEAFQRAVNALLDHLGTAVLRLDRKSTRLNSSHSSISYAVFCLKKKLPMEKLGFASAEVSTKKAWVQREAPTFGIEKYRRRIDVFANAVELLAIEDTVESPEEVK